MNLPVAQSLENAEPTAHRRGRLAGFAIVRVVLGTLLLAAAGFKAHALWTDPNPPLAVFTSPRWQVAFIEIETLLGLWLLAGIYPVGAWAASLVTFTFLGAVSFYLAIIGQPSCGCFGKVPINPWYTFCLDVMAVAALAYWQPGCQSFPTLLRESWHSFLRPNRGSLIKAGCFLAMGILAVYAINYSDAFAQLCGDSLTVEPTVLDAGTGVQGETRKIEFQVRNHTDKTIQIIGGTTTCNLGFDGLPIAVRGRESKRINAKLTFAGSPGEFQKPFVLFTDDPSHPVIQARLSWRITENGG